MNQSNKTKETMYRKKLNSGLFNKWILQNC